MQGRLPRQAPRGFRMSMAENEFMQMHIQNLLDKGLIIPTLGPFGSPILVVKKPHVLNGIKMRDRLQKT